jgi:hypothetical protein
MNPAPFGAQVRCFFLESRLDFRKLTLRELLVFTQFRRPIRAIKLKNGFTVLPENMNVGWPMIVRIDHNTQTTNRVNGRHYTINLSVWVIFFNPSLSYCFSRLLKSQNHHQSGLRARHHDSNLDDV